jgi:hypothetical protein
VPNAPNAELVEVKGELVTTQQIPLIDNYLFFSFLHHHDIMHHHASITLHVFVKSKIIWNQIYFYFARMTMKPSLTISFFF